MWGMGGPQGPPVELAGSQSFVEDKPSFPGTSPTPRQWCVPMDHWRGSDRVSAGSTCPIRKPRLSDPAELLTEAPGTMLRGRRRVRVFARLLT